MFSKVMAHVIEFRKVNFLRKIVVKSVERAGDKTKTSAIVSSTEDYQFLLLKWFDVNELTFIEPIVASNLEKM